MTARPRGPAAARPVGPARAGLGAAPACAAPFRGASARLSAPRFLATLAGLVGVVLAGCSDAGRLQLAAPPGEWVYMGTNPFAAAQPTALGRRLHTLQGWGNELYMGYGDYDEDTGPIEISTYHPGLKTFSSKLRFDTEAVELYRPIGDRLYAPAIDPVGSGQSASVAVGEPGGRWWNNKNVFVTHAFDIATLDGSDLWLVGSRGARALAAHSTDGGRSWTTALSVPPVSAGGEDFARFYFAFAHGGRLYVQAEDAIGGPHPRSRVLSGSRWTDGPDLQALVRTGCKPLAFSGRVVYLGGFGLMAFDGVSARRIGFPARDLVVDGGVLYVLEASRVRRTTDLSTWTEVAAPPARAVSIGVLDGWLYAGTAQSELYRFSRPMDPGFSRQ